MTDPPQTRDLATRLFSVSDDVRYVAIYRGEGQPELHQRSGIEGASESETDRYEELLVNPAILLLASQRGNIDCGGLEYVLIRYGSFFQLVHPSSPGSHVSVAIEVGPDVLRVVEAVRAELAKVRPR